MMVHPNGHRTVVEYSSANILNVSVDGFQLKCVSDLSIKDGAPDEIAEVTLTFYPGEIIIKRKGDEP